GGPGASVPARARAHPAPRRAHRGAFAGRAVPLPRAGRTARRRPRARRVPGLLGLGPARFVHAARAHPGDAAQQAAVAPRVAAEAATHSPTSARVDPRCHRIPPSATLPEWTGTHAVGVATQRYARGVSPCHATCTT